ncbi:MAG: ATP-binding protein [Solirubrobacterales bacterium]|nr:ATP-binding protein [Solirubrobacterales bacterium]
MRFVGRDHDLQLLNEQYREVVESGAGRFISMRGRRRVGKSTLIEEFLRQAGLPHVFFAASRQSLDRELEMFLEELAGSGLEAGESVRAGVTPSTWEGALTLLAQTADTERPAVVVIDEFPWMVEQDESIEAVFQKAWDRRLKKVPVLLILVGSDLAMMEALTSYGRPLYGRPTREMVVEPLTPAEIGDLLRVDAAEALDAYATIGGFPQLAMAWPAGASRAEFVERMLQDEHSAFIVSGERSVTAEFPPQTSPRAVFSAIGYGETGFNRISQRAGIGASQLSEILSTLEQKRAIRKLIPFAGKDNSKAKRYVVSDPYLRFWLRFIEPNLAVVERGRGRAVAERVEASWIAYRGKAVEPIVGASLERLLPDERFGESRHISGYWTRDNRIEVDLVGSEEGHDPRRASLVGSIKWRENDTFDRHDAKALQDHRGKVPRADSGTLLVGISRQGFEDNLGLDVQLGPDDLIGAWR